MNNRKAQALIEFVLILPILIMILFAIIDFGNIFVTKSSLENKLDDAYEVLKSSTDITTLQSDVENVVTASSSNDIEVSISFENNGYVKITLTDEIKTITPGLNLILGYPYKVKVERVVKHAEQ